MSQCHAFDIGFAAEFGINEALIIQHFQHWIRVNARRKKNLKKTEIDGKICERTFSYQKRADIEAHFPYFSFDQVRYAIENLLSLGVLIARNFNKSPMDHTLWYAFVDEKKFGLDKESIEKLYENSNNVCERENSPSEGEIQKMFAKGKIPLSKGKIPFSLPDTKPTDTYEEEARASAPPPSYEGKDVRSAQKIVEDCKECGLPFKSAFLHKLISDFGPDCVRQNIYFFINALKKNPIPKPSGFLYKACVGKWAEKKAWKKANIAFLQDFMKSTGWASPVVMSSYVKIPNLGKELYFESDPDNFKLVIKFWYISEKGDDQEI